MATHDYAEGQRWTFRSTVAEFEHELVIGRILPMSQMPIPGFHQPDQYWAFVRRTDAPNAPRDFEGITLVLTADALDRNVERLVEEGAALPEWWEYGKPLAPGAPQHRGGIQVEGDIDDVLRHLVGAQQLIDEGRRRSAATPSVDEVREQLRPWLEQHARPAWLPAVRDGDGSLTASKFAGTPWLAAGEPWPACGACGRPMQLFLQLNLDDLPDPGLRARFGDGLLQLFYCMATHRLARPIEDFAKLAGQFVTGDAAADFLRMACSANGGRPFEPGNLARVVQPGGAAAQPVPSYAGEDPPLAPKLITGWRRVRDLPHHQDHDELGLQIDYDFHRHTATVTCAPLGLVFRDVVEDISEQLATALDGDKLAGWPAWVQDAEYPRCPRCGARMEFAFQLDSNDHLDFMFGDAGTGHVTQCPTHKEVVAFGWACS